MKNSADLGGCYPPRPSASVDNTLLDLQNSFYPTLPHSIIAQYTLHVWSQGKQLVLLSRESWCFAEQSRGKHQDLRESKTNWFPEGSYTKCFVTYLDFPWNNHIAKANKKQRGRAGNNCAIVSRSAYIWIWSWTRDQESTYRSAHFVEWKSSYITIAVVSRCKSNHSRL